MAFVTPFTAVAGAVFTSAQWNVSGRDNLVFLNTELSGISLDLAGTSVTGTLPIGHGGTGATTAALARSGLGIGGIAVYASPLPLLRGGTGATTAAAARASLGLTSVDWIVRQSAAPEHR